MVLWKSTCNYFSGGDRFLDARDLIVNNIDYIVEETIGFLNTQYPTLTYDQAKCARDTRLVIAAWTNDLKYGGNYFSIDAAEQYTLAQEFSTLVVKKQRQSMRLIKQETYVY